MVARFVMHPLLRPVEAILPRASRQFGMKARNLAALSRAGFPVPAAYVLSCEATDQLLARTLAPELQLSKVIEADHVSIDALAEIRQSILNADVGGDLRDALRGAFVELEHAGAHAVVLRPSRIVSEEAEAAVAGLHESTLALGSVEAVINAALRCWASLYTPAAITCARTLGADQIGSLALVIQAMVPAEASGTLWTANPLTNDASEMTLEAVFGLGLGLHDAMITPDVYQIDRRSHWIRDRVVGRKERAFGLGNDGTLQPRAVDVGQQHKEALDDHTLRQMVELGRRIEAHFGDPREIEWAVVADAVYVLHARPIAARPGMISIGDASRGRDDRDLANAQWLSVGAFEPLSDVVTPLTWSAVNAFCRDGLPRVLKEIGVETQRGTQGVRCHRGRAFVDVGELSLLGPGFELFLDGANQLPSATAGQGLSVRDLMSIPMQVLRYGRQRHQRRARLPDMERMFHSERARLLSIDPRILSGVGLADTLFDAQRLTDRLMRQWIVCTTDLLSSWGLLRRALSTLGSAQARSIELGLLCGIDSMHGDDAVSALEPLIAISRDPSVREQLPTEPSDNVSFARFAGSPVHGALAGFLSDHGHRAHQELELSSPRWEERPAVALAMACSPIALDTRSNAGIGRQAAAAVFARAQRELAQHWGDALSTALQPLVQAVRRDIAERERVRGWVLRSWSLVRRCVVDASRRLSTREPMVRDDAAFLMTLDELRSYLRSEIRAVAQLVTLRRALQRQVEALPSPPDAFVGYPQPVANATQWTRLNGAAVSPGSVRGVARVITSIADIARVHPGDVLILRQLDAAWAPLMCRAAGVCAELGGPLSSGATMLRQYGVPAVSNLGRSLRSVRNGETLRVDADRACIERIADAS